ncbi:MAG TPA: glycosyltransferase family A protein [Acidimicrobiia bacterium]|nr:glycosyltransferase family A protein [Acidimicrobiia bacterium]
MNETPTISVIITFWNRERYLAESIESVVAQPMPLDLVLVDDGSTDASAEAARRFSPPARLVQQDHRGAAGAYNTGLEHTTGTLVAFCDSDDLWTRDKLDIQLAALERDPRLDCVFGHAEEFLSPELDPAAVRTRPLRGVVPAVIPSAALIRRPMLDAVGPFDEQLRNGAWVDWYARARVHGLNECIPPEVLVRRRIHERNNFAAQEDAARGYLRALRPLVRKQRES